MNGAGPSASGSNDAPQYDESFPPLSGPTNVTVGSAASSKKPLATIETSKRLPPKVKPVNTTVPTAAGKQNRAGNSSTVLCIPWEERRFQQVGMSGEGAQAVQQRKICQDIAQKTHVSIDLQVNKDRSLSVSISGKGDAVHESKRLLARDLMVQSQTKVDIPREYHRFILGTKGKNLHEIENRNGVKITVPRPDDASDEIYLHGNKDALNAAREEILAIYHDQSKRSQEVLNIPKIYHSLLCGPSNRFIEELRQRTGVKINIPPVTAVNEGIVLSGEKDAVALVKRELLTRSQTIQKDCGTLTFPVPKNQHRYIIGVRGSGLSEILEQTGVSIEVPPADTDTEEIVLRGPQAQLGHALSLMVERARSIQQRTIHAPAWIHRYLIGKNGSNLSKITANHEKVRVDFHDNEDTISVEGPLQDVEAVCDQLNFEVKQLISNLSFVELPAVSQIYLKHIVGRAGANIERLQTEFGVQIKLQSTGVVRIEGPPSGVEQAKLDIEKLLQKKENEKQKDLIIDHRYHRQLIGAQGSRIRDLRDRYPNVQINFPEMRQQSNIVQLRGPRQDVDIVAQELTACYKELANVEEVPVTIPSGLLSALLGDKGHVLRSIQAECSEAVHIRFPRLEKADSNGHGKVSSATEEQVIIKGPKEEAHKAKQLLLQLAKEKEALSYEETLTCRAELHKYIIGKGGAHLQELRQATGARVILPAANSGTESDVITLIGSKDSVTKAKELLKTRITELESITESVVQIDPKWHKQFVQRRGQMLTNIAQEFGGVNISFPRVDDASSDVRVKGPSKYVEGAIKRLQEIVTDLESQVVLEVQIPAQHHRAVIGVNGQQVKDIQEHHRVNIKFPPVVVGDAGDGVEPEPITISGRRENCEDAKNALLELVPIEENIPLAHEYHGLLIGQKGQGIQQLQREHGVQIQIPEASLEAAHVVVRGTPSRLLKFKEALEKLMTEWEGERQDRLARSYETEVFVPAIYHRQLIGQRGVRINEVIDRYEVNIQMPQQSASNRKKQAAKETTEDSNGVNGAAAEENDEKAIQESEKVAADDKTTDKIVIRGYKEKAEAAKVAILERVEYLKRLVSVELNLPNEIHNRLIGQKGRVLRKLVEDYGVEDITFPSPGAKDKDLVVVTGLSEKVDTCCDHLIDLANEYMNQYEERQAQVAAKAPVIVIQNAQRNAAANHNSGQSSGFFVAGAPWQQRNNGNTGLVTKPSIPDTNNDEEFPSIAGAGNNHFDASTPSNGWGESVM